MKNRRADSEELVGLLRIRQHCTFTWRKAGPQHERSVDVYSSHCADCIEEVRREGYRLVFMDVERPI